MSYGTAGESKVSLSHTNRMSRLRTIHPPHHDGPYVKSQYRTFALRVFRENLIFSLLSAYSLTHRVTRNTLKPPNLDYNLYTM
jgi:hypothetical protein